MSENIIFEPSGSYNYYCLFEIKIPGVIYPQPIVMRLLHPIISNCNLRGQDLAETIVEHKRDSMMEQILEETKAYWYRLVGYCEQSPEGDDFYEETGKKWIDFWTFETKHYHPWMIFGQAVDEEEMMRLLEEEYNEDLRTLEPVYPPEKWHAWYVTEEDYQVFTENVIDQCVEWIEKASDSSVFTNKYVFLNSFLEEGWQFEQLYVYRDLFSDSPMMSFYEERSFSWRGKLKVTFYPERKHLSFHCKADYILDQTVMEFGFNLMNVEELKTVVVELRYLREVLNYDFQAFFLRIKNENITAYWEVDGKRAGKIEGDKLLGNRYLHTTSSKEMTNHIFQKVPLGIPAGFKMVWNTFCEVPLVAARKHADSCHKYFTEDLLLLKEIDGSKSLHLGWSSDLDLSGGYQLSLSNHVEEEEAYHEYQNEDIHGMIDSIHETLSIWRNIEEPEAHTLVPIRIATGWEIQYNRWVKTGRYFFDREPEDVKCQLLFMAVKHNVGCIRVHYREQKVPCYEIGFQESMKDSGMVKEFQEEEKAVATLEYWMEYAHMGKSCLEA